MARKAYEAPALTVYGAVRDITRNGGAPNSDVPRGPGNTAYSAA
jgi:hypothetical protein